MNLVWLAVACTDPVATAPDEGEHSGLEEDSDTSSATSSSEPDCTVSPSVLGFHSLQAFEDFDFLPDGRLVSGFNDSLVVTDADWGTGAEILGPGLGANPTGVRVLPSGDIAVAEVSGGNVSLVDATSGGFVNLVSGMSSPNGLAISRDGALYISEHIDGGRILRLDLQTSAIGVVLTSASTDAPNGLSLSADDRTLFVAVGSRIDRVDLSDGSVEILHEFGAGEFDTVAVDVCDAAYTIDYNGGVLYRIRADGAVDELATIDGYSYRTGLRWGIGTTALPRDHLYLSARTQGVTEIAIGVDGVPPVF